LSDSSLNRTRKEIGEYEKIFSLYFPVLSKEDKALPKTPLSLMFLQHDSDA